MKKSKMFFCILLTIILLFTLYKYGTGISNHVTAENFDILSPKYVFWTGGYDSTFRVCELLIIHKVPVQPIYLSYNLDSKHKSDIWVRKNRNEEKEAMVKIRNIIINRFPYTKNLLYKTIDINDNIEYEIYDDAFLKLNLWPKKRKIHQYSHMGKISFLMKTYIDTGVLGLHGHSNFVNFLNKKLRRNKTTYDLDVSIFHPLHYLQFPLIQKTKKDLCDISKQHNFNDIIKMSWSCWFPVDGKPCKKCPMCIERFECN